jgi:hypothetical protein
VVLPFGSTQTSYITYRLPVNETTLMRRNDLVNHKYAMRITDLCEAPIGSITADGVTDTGSFSSRSDRAIATSPRAHAKIRRILLRVPQILDLVFLDTGSAIPTGTLDYYHENIAGVFDYRSLVDKFPLPELTDPTGIMFVITNNEGRERVQLSPWIIAHRLGHGLAFDPHFEGMLQNINYEVRDVGTMLYDGFGLPRIFTNMAMGTMKSCREKRLTVAAEFVFEMWAQFLVQGRVRLNRLTLDGLNRLIADEGTISYSVTASQRDVDEANRMVDYLERAANREIPVILKAAEGKVVVL